MVSSFLTETLPRLRPMAKHVQSGLFESLVSDISEPLVCFGQSFPTDEARRAYFIARLREMLADPHFHQLSGFPSSDDESIVQMSDPPYYTACPNPFIADFIRCAMRSVTDSQVYHREPLAVDVSEGKSDEIYNAHSYHTKVPYR